MGLNELWTIIGPDETFDMIQGKLESGCWNKNFQIPTSRFFSKDHGIGNTKLELVVRKRSIIKQKKRSAF